MQQLLPATVLIVSMASLPCGFRAAAVAKKAKPCFRKRPMRYLVAFDFWPPASGAKRFMPEAKRNRQTICRTIGIRWASVMAQFRQEAGYSCCPLMPAYWWRCAPMRPKPVSYTHLDVYKRQGYASLELPRHPKSCLISGSNF